MTDDLAALRDKRTGYSRCTNCGGAYFHVDVVTLSPNGCAAGYSGRPTCANCGQVVRGELWNEPDKRNDEETP